MVQTIDIIKILVFVLAILGLLFFFVWLWFEKEKERFKNYLETERRKLKNQ